MVTATIWIRMTSNAEPSIVNNAFVTNVDSTTMAIFTKLFAMRMVASSLSGKESNCTAILFSLELPSLSLSIFPGVREKNATSLPEIIPEIRSNTNMTSNPIRTPGVNLPTVIVSINALLLIV
jgi:hypothetical protein